MIYGTEKNIIWSEYSIYNDFPEFTDMASELNGFVIKTKRQKMPEFTDMASELNCFIIKSTKEDQPEVTYFAGEINNFII